MTNNYTTDINNAVARLNEIFAEVKTISSTVINDMGRSLLEKYPHIKTIFWTQYTPGFNDGDPCEFGVYGPYFTTTPWEDVDTGYEDSEDVYENEELLIRSDGNGNAELEADIKAFGEVFSMIRDHLESTFGSYGAFVRIHAGGIETEDYDCGY
jgi:hypothetical protein